MTAVPLDLAPVPLSGALPAPAPAPLSTPTLVLSVVEDAAGAVALTGRPARIAKSALDRLGALLLIVALLPVLLVVAAAVRIGDGGPAFFLQRRVGRDGREFRMIKFRTMVVHAEAQLSDLTSDRGNVVMFKARVDPRITRVGSFLRRSSFDELPQLFNVLAGDMSLVGPRPPLPAEVEGYDEHARRRLSVRPGITGLWQVSGRSDLDWHETVRLDLQYIDSWSLRSDAVILLRTIGAVVSARGAY